MEEGQEGPYIFLSVYYFSIDFMVQWCLCHFSLESTGEGVRLDPEFVNV
jgi:hypothetical protein